TVDPEGLLDDAFPDGRVPVFGTLGSAVAHCEDELLARYAPDLPLPAVVPAVESPVLAQLDPPDAAALVARMERRHFTHGEVVRRVGQRFGGGYVIGSGHVATTTRGNEGRRAVVSALIPRTSF